MTIKTDSSDKTSDLNLVELISLCWKGWKILVGLTVLGAVSGVLLSRWMQPVFQANALLQVDTDQKTLAGMDQLAEVFGASSKAETEIEILQSRMVLLPVVDSLHLNFSAIPSGIVRRLMGRQGRILFRELKIPEPRAGEKRPWTLATTSESTVVLRNPNGDSLCVLRTETPFDTIYRSDTIRITLQQIHSSTGEVFGLQVRSRSEVAQSILRSIVVTERGKKTGILSVALLNRYPDRAAAILNEVIKSYLRQNIDAKSAEAQKTLAFLEQQLPAVKARLDSADSTLNAYRLAKGTIDLSTEARLALDQQVKLQQSILELQQEKQSLVRLYKEDHPQVQALNARIDKINQALGRSSGQVKTLPETQQEVVKLTRDVTVSTAFYQTMLDKIQQLQVVRAGEVGSVRLIDLAEETSYPIKPNRKLIILVCIGFGFFVGFGILIIWKSFDRGVKDSSEIEKMTGNNVVATIPMCSLEEKGSKKSGIRDILSQYAPDDLSVESLRSLRTALEFSMLSGGGKVLAITGLVPGVGKSFVSMNLAFLFALTNRRVLLIDADLRMGRLHTYFDGNRNNGLSEILLGKLGIDNALRKINAVGNLNFVPTGSLPTNPSEMLGSTQMGEFLAEMRKQFDLIILDTSPVLLVTDPTIVLRNADHSSLVLEHGRHHREEILEGVKLLKIRESLNLSIVLNKCQNELPGYGKYGKYGTYGSNVASSSARK